MIFFELFKISTNNYGFVNGDFGKRLQQKKKKSPDRPGTDYKGLLLLA